MAQLDSGKHSSVADQSSGHEMLRAQLAIEPDTESSCAVVQRGVDAATFTQNLKKPGSCFEPDYRDTNADCTHGECHAEVTYATGEEGGSEYVKSDVHHKCICPVFEEHDCIPKLKGVRSGSVIVVVSVRTREVLRELLDDLREINASVSIEWLVRGEAPEATVEIDVSDVTTKQQEALETALDAGYYNTPRETDLADLANQLSISESAVSQRLNAAETKLVKSFLSERQFD